MKNSQELKKKQLWFLDQLSKDFTLNTRGTISDRPNATCSYTAGCAIGRKISGRLAKKLDKLSLSGIANYDAYRQLPLHLKNLGQDFLSRIQWIHDHEDNWDDTGLSAEGIQAVEQAKKEFYLI